MYIGCEVFIIVTSGIILIDNPYVFEMSRVLVGFTGGMILAIAPPTVYEVLPSQISGKFSIGILSCFYIGVLSSSLMAASLHDID